MRNRLIKTVFFGSKHSRESIFFSTLNPRKSARPPHPPTPVRVLTAFGAAGAKANSCGFTQPLWDGCAFNPNLPAANSLIQSTELRAQFNGLKELIDNIPAGPPGEQGPAGSDGGQGPPGNDGNPGEVTNATLAWAIVGTARNPATAAPLGLTVSDPPTAAELQQVVNKIDELIAALFRPPI